MSAPHPVLRRAADAARTAYLDAQARLSRAKLTEEVAMGADGTPTMRIDTLVENAILAELDGERVNILSEESGWLDRGGDLTLVMDPLDGSANGAAGVPLTAFAGTLVVGGEYTEAYTVWLDTGRSWGAKVGEPTPLRTSGRRELTGAAVSLLRPHPAKPSAAGWWAVAQRAARVRILSSSCLEAALVAQGSIDAFADAGGDIHRLVDLSAAVVTVTAAGGAVRDVWGRSLAFDTDLTKRWSGVVAATPDLADELAELLRARVLSGRPPVL